MKRHRFLRSQLVLARPIAEHCSLPVTRVAQDLIGQRMSGHHADEAIFSHFSVKGIPCALITPKEECSNGVLLYLHGGGYTCGGLEYAKGFATVLAVRLGIRVMTVEYRLAPEEPYPAALDDCLEAYGYLLSNGYDASRIILCGESAGGGLAYALCQKLRAKGRTLPAGVIAVSPWTDLTMSGPSYTENLKRDPSITRERLKYFADCYAYGEAIGEKPLTPRTNANPEDDLRVKRHPLLSPLFADLAGMPPSLIFVGGDEIMRDDSVALHQKLTQSGCKSQLVVAEGLWHAYLLYGIKERDGDYDRMMRFIKVNIPQQKKLRWMTLDNAAKIFPAARSRTWTNVFRLSATLTEDVDTDALRTALDVTIRRFPSIAVRVRAGVFWYYLEEIPHAPEIAEEKPCPLTRIPFDDIRKCAFRVIAYRRRIAVEFFHALTDGNGGLIFLNTLVAEYLYQKYGEKLHRGNHILDRLENPTPEELEDSFLKYAGKRAASRTEEKSYHILGKKEEDGYKTNTTFILDADQIVKEAKQRGVTVTAYMASALLLAAMRIQEKRVKNPARRRVVKICSPVNLRKLFPSKTLRNFILYANPGIDPKLGDYTFDEICQSLHHQMKVMITDKNMAALAAANVNDEKNPIIKVVPRFLKDIVMKMVFNAVGEKVTCFSFSNLGVVSEPEAFTRHVERLDFVIGVQASAPYNTSALTYQGKMYLNMIRNIREPVLERAFFEVLTELGIRPCVESNTREKE